MKSQPLLRIVLPEDEPPFDQRETSVLPRISGSAPMPRLEPAPVPAPTPAPVSIPDPQPERAPGRSLAGRALALSLLAATVAGLAWLGTQVYHVLTDAWIAPLHLSPDNDAIAQLRLHHQRNLAEIARLDAEVTRLDGALVAIDVAVDKLSALRGTADETLRWRAEHSRVEVEGLGTAATLMQRQRDVLRDLHARQVGLVARTRQDLAAGLVDRTALDRELQVEGQLALQIAELDRQIAEATIRQKHSRTALRALSGASPRTQAGGLMPEVAAGGEHAARIEVEIERLHAEARGHRAQRAAATAAISAQRALLAELEARPLYRAMKADTDVAFVPYDQLAGVRPGGTVVACVWGVFACEPVGAIAEVLPGEVVTQDPWGEMARGQYAVLELRDPEAIRERVLRVRE